MTRLRLAAIAMACITVSATAAYLYDPPWIAGVTSGMREWEEDPPGTRFRWTAGRASFFVPGRAATLTLPMRAVFPLTNGQPVVVSVSVDDRFLANVALTQPHEWEFTTLPLPRAQPFRHHRRIELRISRVVAPNNLGVEVGEAQLHP